jgi:NADPH:quinone reductase-like Zn-dependent oxidoreductase
MGDMPYFVWLLLRTLANPQKRKDFKMLKKPEAMAIFRELLESGKLTPIVGKTFSLGGVAAALQWMREGQAPGRAIITP